MIAVQGDLRAINTKLIQLGPPLYRYYDMTPYWELERDDYPFTKMYNSKEYVEVPKADLDTFYSPIPNVPIRKMETHNFPRANKIRIQFFYKLRGLTKYDSDHYGLILHTDIGVFTVDRYLASIDIIFRTEEQHNQFMTTSKHEVNEDYYELESRVWLSDQPNKSMHDIIRVLKASKRATISFLTIVSGIQMNGIARLKCPKNNPVKVI